MVVYTCIRCGATFKQKQHYKNHLDRKNKCIDLTNSINNVVEQELSKAMSFFNNYYSKGKYFTKNEKLKESVYSLILNNSSVILEPSVGRGDLVDYVKERKANATFDLFEIDQTIEFLDCINKDNIIFGDFLKQKITKKYDTIIGNPPYIKTKTGNIYIEFIQRCFELLNQDGELIFIVPSDFIKLTCCEKIINLMMENGCFTHFIHLNNESLFTNACIDVITFRYCKNKNLPKTCLYNNEKKYIINSNGILSFNDEDVCHENIKRLENYFDIYVGMVTGKEEIFKNDKYGNITLLNDENKQEKYILLDSFPTENEELDNYMLSHKETLKSRKIKNFNETNWFKWGALRNKASIEARLNKKCIFVNNLTRKNKIAFIDKVQYFGGSLLIMIPKNENKINLSNFVDFMNTEEYKKYYTYSGRFKIGHKQLCNSIIPPDINIFHSSTLQEDC